VTAVTRKKAEEYRRLAQQCLAMACTLSNAEARVSALQMAQVWQRLADESRTEAPISPKVPRHHPAVGKSNRSFNSNNRSNPRTTTQRNKPPHSPLGG
jgi:hypothetical protein